MQPQDDMSTRETILYLLKTNDELSAKELTERLNITSMAVRRHIDALERDGFIDSRTVRQPMGRPSAMYYLTERASILFPNKYHAVALDLLHELVQESGENMVERLFERRKDALYKKHAESMEDKSFQEKIALLANIQNENGYMVELKKNSDDEFVFTEHNCPISQIANKYNHACTCELKLFESLLDADISRPECLSKGDRKCVYTIRRRNRQS
ncbi:transcriptional regulator [Paenibacillus profundus]|uniref:Transcriptional regulator n=1 Tax=Paenibacillus profundus TaxID=1173085 RepID=A0ABS8YLJ9_9BACL|nr:metalloregulator ArsR/SmtB family transcription factor [Paenibacillus profundus]MCE5172711.1 transcriptional regulator [Paenibacillus profundus]